MRRSPSRPPRRAPTSSAATSRRTRRAAGARARLPRAPAPAFPARGGSLGCTRARAHARTYAAPALGCAPRPCSARALCRLLTSLALKHTCSLSLFLFLPTPPPLSLSLTHFNTVGRSVALSHCRSPSVGLRFSLSLPPSLPLSIPPSLPPSLPPPSLPTYHPP